MSQGVRPPLEARINRPRGHRVPRLGRNDCGCLAGDLRGITKDFNSHGSSLGLYLGRLLHVPAELEAHGGQQLVLEIRLAA
jgi:hypothetical protein